MTSKHLKALTWTFVFSERARADFKTLEKTDKVRIQKKIESILAAKTNPIQFFKPLTGTLKNLYRLRIGDLRLICEIDGGK